MMRAVAVTLCAIGLFGCTNQLEVKPVGIAAEGSNLEEGVPYYLPQTDIEIEVVATIRSCSAEELGLKLDTTLKPVRAADLSRPYLIDMQSLQAPLKHSTIKVERHPDGTLKLINGESDDKTLEVGASVLSFARDIFVSAARAGIGVFENGEERKFQTPAIYNCTPLNESILDRDAKVLEVKNLTKEIAALRARILEMTDPQRQKLNRLQARLVAAQANLVQATARISTTLKARWTPRLGVHDASCRAATAPQEGGTGQAVKPDRSRSASCRLVPDPGSKFIAGLANKGVASSGVLRHSFTFQIRASMPDGQPLPSTKTVSTRSLVFREPALADIALTQCKPAQDSFGNYDPSTLDCEQPDNSGRLPKRVLVSQFGRSYVLPFRNDIFDDNVLTAKFNAQGRLTSASYESEAAAQDAAKLLAKAGAEVRAAQEGAEARAVSEAEARNKLLQAEIDRIKKRAELEALRAE